LKKILECVPNFSEGQDNTVIQAIENAIKKVKAVKLLDIDTGFHANRTVYTFLGEPESVVDAAFEAAKTASKLIDMHFHKGEHPRIGALDVCPFIPIEGIEMEEVIHLSHLFGQRVASELQIPVYLYEKSALKSERKNLAWIRSGEYENLAQKMKRIDFLPDYGTSEFNSKSGIVITGAREFLIAYNINLDTKNIDLAKNIAEIIRESGKNGVSGMLKNVKAIAWYIKEFDKIQISMNLTNYKITPLWKVFETVREVAASQGINITGSELVGMIPLKAIAETGIYFLQKEQKPINLNQHQLVEHAVKYLGLKEIKPFDIQKKVIEFALEND
jgi:glutamate formiminotransferase/formiminotetrahydrofolate cyclodeaminase